MPPSPPPEHEALLKEVQEVRRAGLLRLRELELPLLTGYAAALGNARSRTPAVALERLLRLAVARIDGGTLREAAEFTLGLAYGTRDWPPAQRRGRAAQVYGVSTERFRKHQELLVLGEVADQLTRIAGAAGAAAVPQVPAGHRTLRVRAGGRAAILRVHIHPVDLLRDVDVVVSPTNTFLALPEAYKSSVSASLRRVGAERAPGGKLLADAVHDELRARAAEYGTPVLPGTVVPTGSGALAGQGLRRLYHAAVAVPRPGTNDYDVLPADVTRCTANAFRLLAEEAGRLGPPPVSVCFPLLGAGRGGLAPAASAQSIWAAVEVELARGADWEVHVVVRRAERADLLEELLTGGGER